MTNKEIAAVNDALAAHHKERFAGTEIAEEILERFEMAIEEAQEAQDTPTDTAAMADQWGALLK